MKEPEETELKGMGEEEERGGLQELQGPKV